MARIPRYLFLAETNHIMLRGIGRMTLFYQKEDYLKFREILKNVTKSENVAVLAYCLMDNHVHLLLQADPKDIPLFLKRVEISYALYFNRVYERVGHLFQNRYRSEPVYDKSYLMNALRYILHNPEVAGIGNWRTYRWSSAKCYLRGVPDGITADQRALEIMGSRKELCLFLDKASNKEQSKLAEPADLRHGFSDAAAVKIICRTCELTGPEKLGTLDRPTMLVYLTKLKKEGLTIRQLERVTGINRNLIQRASSDIR